MADNRKSTRNFDLNKSQKHSFDLEKEIGNDTPLPSAPPRKKWPKILIPILVVAVIAVLAIVLWPKGDSVNKNTATGIPNAETADNTTANDNVIGNSVEEENQTAEQSADEASAPAEEVSKTTEAVETPTGEPVVAQPAGNKTTPKPGSHSKPANSTTPSHHTSGTLTGDVEQDAKAVIRGEFGNGDDRKAALGNRYREIQDRVNEIYREKHNN